MMAEEAARARPGRRALLDPSARAIGIVSLTATSLAACTQPPSTPANQVVEDAAAIPAPTLGATPGSDKVNARPSHRPGTAAERVRAILTAHVDAQAGRLPGSAAIPGDSLDRIELVMAIEEEFGIEIPDDDAQRFATIGDLITYVERNATR